MKRRILALLLVFAMFAALIVEIAPEEEMVGQIGGRSTHEKTSYNNNYGLRHGSQPRLFPSQSRSC